MAELWNAELAEQEQTANVSEKPPKGKGFGAILAALGAFVTLKAFPAIKRFGIICGKGIAKGWRITKHFAVTKAFPAIKRFGIICGRGIAEGWRITKHFAVTKAFPAIKRGWYAFTEWLANEAFPRMILFGIKLKNGAIRLARFCKAMFSVMLEKLLPKKGVE